MAERKGMYGWPVCMAERGMCGRGACVAGGMCGRGTSMAGGMHGGGVHDKGMHCSGHA